MRILILGAGAIGSLLAHRLGSAHHDVTLVGRPAAVRAIQENGLILEEPTIQHQPTKIMPCLRRAEHTPYSSPTHPRVVTSLHEHYSDRRSWDLAILAVKVFDTSSAAQELQPYLTPDVPLLIAQNGVGGEEIAQRELSEANVVSMVVTLSVSVLAPGRVRLETHHGGLSLAPTKADQDVRCWEQMLTHAGFRTAIFADYRAMKWSKLLLNLQANAIPAILGQTPNGVYADPSLFALERTAFLEAYHVMKALGLEPVNFPGYPVTWLAWAMCAMPAIVLRPIMQRLVSSGRGDKPPSLQIGLLSGHERSEVAYLNGAVAAHGETLKITTPVNRALTDILMSIARGDTEWSRFRGQPNRLLAAITAMKEQSHDPDAVAE